MLPHFRFGRGLPLISPTVKWGLFCSYACGPASCPIHYGSPLPDHPLINGACGFRHLSCLQNTGQLLILWPPPCWCCLPGACRQLKMHHLEGVERWKYPFPYSLQQEAEVFHQDVRKANFCSENLIIRYVIFLLLILPPLMPNGFTAVPIGDTDDFMIGYAQIWSGILIYTMLSYGWLCSALLCSTNA